MADSLYDSLYRNIANMPQGGGAPVRKAEKPGLLDYVWGVAAGYNPNDIRRGFDSRERELQAKEAQTRAQAGLASMFDGGTPAPAMGAMPPIPGAAPQLGGAPTQGGAPQGGGLPRRFDPRSIVPALLQAQAAGVDTAPYFKALEATRPDVEVVNGVAVDRRDTSNIGRRVGGVALDNVNGVLVDPNDPTNTNRFVPQVGEGQEVVYDGQGRAMVRDLPGYTQSVAGREGAIAGARASAQNPYTLTTVQGPDGRPIATSVQNVLQGGAVQGQSEAEKSGAVGRVTQDVTREGEIIASGDAARSAMNTYKDMKAYLPDVISGYGANLRLQAARALAATGNDKAIREVTATQVFQNRARQLVLDIIKSFGANPSNAEREYAEKMQGADVELTPQALAEGIRLGEQRNQAAIERADQVRASRGGVPASGQPIRVTSVAQARSLPPGTVFIDPNGVRRQVPR